MKTVTVYKFMRFDPILGWDVSVNYFTEDDKYFLSRDKFTAEKCLVKIVFPSYYKEIEEEYPPYPIYSTKRVIKVED